MEIWKQIKDYEGLYEVSNLGRVKNSRRGNILKPQILNWYFAVHLSKKGKAKWKTIHRLVAENFIPHKAEYNVVNHIDNNPLNNKVENLEWTTFKGNMEHASKQGRMKYNPNNLKKAQKSNMKKIIAIDNNGKEFFYNSITEAAKELNCNRRHISDICNNKYGYKTSKGFIFKFKEG